MKAGEQLERTQRETLRGGSPAAFMDARREEQAALDRLAGAAREVLDDGGQAASEATLDRIATTLRAAAVNEGGRELLKRGRLAEDLQPQGFEAFGDVDVRSLTAERGQAKPKRRDERRLEEAREAERTARAEATALEQEAQAAEQRATEAARAARAARAKADRASKRAQELAEKVARLSAP